MGDSWEAADEESAAFFGGGGPVGVSVVAVPAVEDVGGLVVLD